jgi:transketolase
MASDDRKFSQLNEIAKKMRIDIIKTLYKVQTGHPGGSLSAVEIMTTLYFSHMRVDCATPGCPDRDRFIASKGHCAPVVYTTLACKGYFPAEELGNLRQLDCMLQGHPDMKRIPGVDLSTGSLGLGLSVGVGLASAAKLDKKDYNTYVLLGDGELQEGQNWEAFMAGSKYKLSNLIAIVDYNGVQLDGTVDDIMPLGNLRRKFEAFDWHVIECDGHDLMALDKAFQMAKQEKDMPSVIIAKTVKGKGVSFMEGKNTWHGKAIGKQEYETAIAELGGSI